MPKDPEFNFSKTVIASFIEKITFGRIKFDHKLYSGVTTLRWFWLPFKWAQHFRHGGWIFLNIKWLKRFYFEENNRKARMHKNK